MLPRAVSVAPPVFQADILRRPSRPVSAIPSRATVEPASGAGGGWPEGGIVISEAE